MHALLAKSIAVIAATMAISVAVRTGTPVSGSSAFRLLADRAGGTRSEILPSHARQDAV